MASVFFSKSHEWARVDGEVAVIGITDYAQQQLGDVVFVELPDIGVTLAQGDQCGVVESVKAASEVYTPVGGDVTEVNEALSDDPARVNADALGDGWFFKIKLADPSEISSLMEKADYEKFIEGEE